MDATATGAVDERSKAGYAFQAYLTRQLFRGEREIARLNKLIEAERLLFRRNTADLATSREEDGFRVITEEDKRL